MPNALDEIISKLEKAYELLEEKKPRFWQKPQAGRDDQARQLIEDLMVHPGLPAAMVPLLQGASNQLKKDLNSPLNRTTARASIVNVRDFALRYKLASHPPSPDRG
jgi:hypothetical protein